MCETTTPQVRLFHGYSDRRRESQSHTRRTERSNTRRKSRSSLARVSPVIWYTQGTEHTPACIWQVRNRFRHDNGSINSSRRPVHSQLQEQVIQYTLHHVPVAHDARARVEGVSQLTARGGVDERIVADELRCSIEFPVSISAHHRRYREAWIFVEGPSSLDKMRP